MQKSALFFGSSDFNSWYLGLLYGLRPKSFLSTSLAKLDEISATLAAYLVDK